MKRVLAQPENGQVESYRRMLLEKRAAVLTNLGVRFDTIATMGGPLSMLDWAKRDPPLGGRDLVHLTRAGYMVVGEAIANAILPARPAARAKP